MVVADETGWRVHAELHWLWVFATPDTTVYAILPGRGFDEAATVLGADFAGVLVRDGWAPYRQFTEALHQTCVGHLLRRCRTLQIDYPRAVLPGQIKSVLQQALAVRDRYAAGTISRHGVAVARGHLEPDSPPCLINGPRFRRCSVSSRISIANGQRSSASSTTRPSTRPIGAPSRRCAARSSRARSTAAAIAPRDNATSAVSMS